MVRRILAIPLAVVVAIAVFLCPVFCVPTNDYTGSYPLTVSAKFSYASTSDLVGPHTIVLGNFNFGEQSIIQAFFREAYSGGFGVYADRISASYILTLPSCKRLYFCASSGAISQNALDYSSLSAYFNSSETFTVTEYYNTPQIDYNVDVNNGYTIMSTTTVSTSNFHWEFTYLCFDNVPAGTYVITDSSSINLTAEKAYINLCPGVFISTGTSLSDIVNSYIAGDSSFPDTISNLSSSVSNSILNASTLEEKQFISSLAQFELDRLVLASNDKNIIQVKDTFVSSLNITLNSFASGSLSLDSALTRLNNKYESSLATAETPEQGIFVNTQYQIALKKLEIYARLQVYDKLDSAVSDDQLSEADEYYQSEEELIDMFEVAEFESALDFQLWFNTLPPSETIEYKKFFDYLLNDSPIRMFLVVPISLILVRILLGTHLVLSRGGDHSSSSVFNRDFVSGSRYDDPFTGD